MKNDAKCDSYSLKFSAAAYTGLKIYKRGEFVKRLERLRTGEQNVNNGIKTVLWLAW